MFTTDIARWEEIARAHQAYFQEIEPAVTVVEVTALMSPEMLIEIEVTAVLVEPLEAASMNMRKRQSKA